MSVILTADGLEKTFGIHTVFSDISLSLHESDRLGVIGPNGAGKSTFLQILSGAVPPDAGTVSLRKGMRLAMVAQDPVFDGNATVREIVLAAVHGSDDPALDAGKIISRTGFPDADARTGVLSGGWRKRLAIAQALAAKPDVLLLDEPTNHLDVEGILWLEKLLTSSPFASIFVTHDRYFLENVSTRVAEINRAYPRGLFSVPGNYSRFLEKREEFLKAQQREQEALAILVEREIEWLRRGAKARTTKSKARIDSAMELQARLASVDARMRTSTTTIDFSASGRMTKRLIECEGVSKSLGGRALFSNLTFTLGPGSRLGILGANGSGKTTLLRVLTGEIEPDSGRAKRAEALRIAYFEQTRTSIDPATPLRRALAPQGDTVLFRDRPIHVAGWAARFLFRAEQLDLPLSRLSGGERARVHIARLMLEPADVLVLDEPANDLDIPTLEVLESNLDDFPGALVLVTHDRYLLDRLSNVLLALGPEGESGFYAELAQWEQAMAAARKPSAASKDERPAQQKTAPAKKKLSYHEAREWETIETRIAQAEADLSAKRAKLEQPDVVTNPALLTTAVAEMEAAQAEVDRLFARWAELEEKQS
jgi:ATP-binding cassette subfamily F protein uup